MHIVSRVVHVVSRVKEKMSLFQFGFRRCNSNPSQSTLQSDEVPSHMPSYESSGLGRVQYEECISRVSELSDPQPAKKKRRLRGTYTSYTPVVRAKIGKWVLENGNKSARNHFLKDFPNPNESTVRKEAYEERMKWQRKQLHPQPVTEIPLQRQGRPPILLVLDEKLVKFLLAVRSRGGILNIHVVRATAKALIDTSPDHQQLPRFNMPRSWVYSFYRRMGLTRRMGTTSRPPVPQGLYEECWNQYLRDILKVKKHNIPPELILNSDQTPSSYMYMYVSVGKQTMTARGSKSVLVKGLMDK